MHNKAPVIWLTLCLLLVAPYLALAGGSDWHEADEGGFRATLNLSSELLTFITKQLDEIRWGSHADEARESCPACAYIADNSEHKLWYPFAVEWTDSTDVKSFDPDVWVLTDERHYRMKEIILFTLRERCLDYVVLGPLTPLKPGKYVIPSMLPEDASPNIAMGMIAFDRVRQLSPKKIVGIRFSADRENRPLEPPKKN
jgi:hypothetical protein